MKKGFTTPFSSFFPGRFFYLSGFFNSLGRAPEHFVPGRVSLAGKPSFFAKLPTNRACGPVRRARRGVILNEKGVHHPFFKLFPRTFLLPFWLFQQSGTRPGTFCPGARFSCGVTAVF
ncbi:hypothetical protein [Ruthenibacterium lactatiformans]|uniref:hypothetical protein n=4 Tax=Ruthenibacterium lactatiformans TaxID=1550024 RepID=UPI0022E1636A|nr:hypothetical protein [Ruthenibacterium lactatiformans]